MCVRMTDSRFCLSHVCFCVLVDARLSAIVSMEACLKVAILCLRLFELLICSNKFVFKFQDFAEISPRAEILPVQEYQSLL